MRAMVLEHPAAIAKAPLRLAVLDAPVPLPGELRIEVAACGVCRTDLHLVEGEITPPRYPVVPGHQVVGHVVESRADGFNAGERVGVAWLQETCGRCEFCESGRENLCDRPAFTGFDRPGGYAEEICAPAAFVYPLPAGLGSDAEVAPLLCAGIIGYRALKRSKLKPGGRVALFGYGASAHLALQVARYWGCKVFVLTRTERSAARALALGATWAGTDAKAMPAAVDAAISFAPAGSVIPPAMRALKKGGTLAIAGIYVDQVPALDYERELFAERELVSVTANTRDDARELLAIAEEASLHADVERFELAQANEALLRLKENRLHAQAAVLMMKA